MEEWRDRWRHWSSTGRLTPVLVGLLCVALIGAAVERGRGNFHRLSTAVSPDDPLEATRVVSPGPGGQAPVRLSRTAATIGSGPQFVSVTLLPGRGMNVYQITAIVPGHGEVGLLMSPPIQGAESTLSGLGDDAHGAASTSLGGAFLLPWAGQLAGQPSAGNSVKVGWEGTTLLLRSNPRSSGRALDGLLLNRAASEVRTEVLPDGQAAEAVFETGNFDGVWPSSVRVQTRTELTAHALELTVTATNIGAQATPFGIGWRPLFALPSGDRAAALLHLPAQAVLGVDGRTGLPTGRELSLRGEGMRGGVDFQSSGGTRLSAEDIDSTYTELKATRPDEPPAAELRDPAFNLGLRVIAESASIRYLHVTAPADQRWVSIAPTTNADDPLGAEWGTMERSGMVRLAPGERLQWKVRLELFALSAGTQP